METDEEIKKQAHDLFISFVKLNPTPELRDALIEKTLNDETIPIEVRRKVSRQIYRVRPGLLWLLANETEARPLGLALNTFELRKLHIPYITQNPNLEAEHLILLFTKKRKRGSDPMSANARQLLLDSLPDEILRKHAVELNRSASKLAFRNGELHKRLKSAFGMEDMPDEWFEEILK